MPDMAKKKKLKAADRHKSSFVIRFPEEYREIMRNISRANRRPIVTEARIALDKHIQSEGKEPPVAD